ncbi:hypothetical protein WR164_03710 [Philodulcilactobacillus myokoensis]|uniref:Uncharacterized protein n=1 Tax=Philodulcilactobacillus myokoensis TaxID=2929573 RepID=A0A9W6B039_9LACO|nr:hypothetical protein [Philodulcilactobacillus myokoensis]GLB46392.1 hypothetical protein WR164_03710 [Philodulcilactobacillus myokoensis]
MVTLGITVFIVLAVLTLLYSLVMFGIQSNHKAVNMKRTRDISIGSLLVAFVVGSVLVL